MAHPGNEIADGQRPSADAVEPSGNSMDAIRSESYIAAVTMNNLSPKLAANDIAQRDAESAPQKRRKERETVVEPPPPDEIAAEDE